MGMVEKKSAQVPFPNVAVAVEETELQTARSQIRRLQAALEEKHRQCEVLAQKNRDLQSRYEALNQQYEATFAENRRLRETMAAPATAKPPASILTDLPQERQISPNPATPPLDDSVFAAAVRLAQACAGAELLFESEAQLAIFFNRMGQIVEILLNATHKLIKGRWEFHSEYIQETIVDAGAWIKLATLSTEEIKTYFFAPELADAKFATRCRLLQQTIDELMLHQLALLKGYRACVHDGSLKLLQALDPELLAEKLDEQKLKLGRWQISSQTVPWLWQRRFVNLYKRKYNELIREDRRAFDRLFRPGFIQGYKKCMAQSTEGVERRA
jgi:predicted component of type VI protein secretion system